MLDWRLTFPALGDHRDLSLALAGLDLDRCAYVVQPGDEPGALVSTLFPGATLSPPVVPPPGGTIVLPREACTLLRGALSAAERRLDVQVGLGAVAARGIVRPAPRARVVELVRSYTGGAVGDPRFEEVTQGRARAPGYSACGDLVNWELFRIGVRDPSIVNREEPSDGLRWHITENLSRPINGARSVGAWVDAAPGLLPKPGDAYLIGTWPDEVQHMGIVLSAGPRSWTTADYGAVDAQGRQSSGVGERAFDGHRLGKQQRTLIGWIDIDRLPKSAPENLPSSPRAPSSALPIVLVAGAGAVAVYLLRT